MRHRSRRCPDPLPGVRSRGSCRRHRSRHRRRHPHRTRRPLAASPSRFPAPGWARWGSCRRGLGHRRCRCRAAPNTDCRGRRWWPRLPPRPWHLGSSRAARVAPGCRPRSWSFELELDAQQIQRDRLADHPIDGHPCHLDAADLRLARELRDAALQVTAAWPLMPSTVRRFPSSTCKSATFENEVPPSPFFGSWAARSSGSCVVPAFRTLSERIFPGEDVVLVAASRPCTGSSGVGRQPVIGRAYPQCRSAADERAILARPRLGRRHQCAQRNRHQHNKREQSRVYPTKDPRQHSCLPRSSLPDACIAPLPRAPVGKNSRTRPSSPP